MLNLVGGVIVLLKSQQKPRSERRALLEPFRPHFLFTFLGVTVHQEIDDIQGMVEKGTVIVGRLWRRTARALCHSTACCILSRRG